MSNLGIRIKCGNLIEEVLISVIKMKITIMMRVIKFATVNTIKSANQARLGLFTSLQIPHHILEVST